MSVAPSLPAVFPGPVVAWLGPSQRTDAASCMALRFLHSGLTSDPAFHARIEERLGVGMWAPACAYFGDYDRCIFTLGLAGAPRSASDPAALLGETWLERVRFIVPRAKASLDRWMVRQFRYAVDSRGARPYGSQFFARVRQAALADADAALAARCDLMASEAARRLENASELLAALVSGKRACLLPGGPV